MPKKKRAGARSYVRGRGFKHTLPRTAKKTGKRYSVSLIKRYSDNLVANLDEGCEMYDTNWRMTLCRRPIAHIIDGKVAICEECWQRALAIGAQLEQERLERRLRVDPQYAAKSA